MNFRESTARWTRTGRGRGGSSACAGAANRAAAALSLRCSAGVKAKGGRSLSPVGPVGHGADADGEDRVGVRLPPAKNARRQQRKGHSLALLKLARAIEWCER